MQKEFDEFIKKSKQSLDEIEKNAESFVEKMGTDANALWSDLKTHFTEIGSTLNDAGEKLKDQAELQGKLGVMEARDHAEKIQKSTEEFLDKVTKDAQQELDTATLKAHLAKMNAEDIWKAKEPELTKLYEESKDEFEVLAKKAGKELNDILLKLTEIR